MEKETDGALPDRLKKKNSQKKSSEAIGGKKRKKSVEREVKTKELLG